ncbi:hypothetical protein CONPUDRAFT_38117, partial [Coniophora puteana RWD-64-598 SS2]
MEMALPQGIPTLEASSTSNYTRPDNVFCNAEIIDLFTECNVHPELRPIKTDHLPIISRLRVEAMAAHPISRRNFRATDWDELRKELRARLRLSPPPETIADEDHFYRYFDLVTGAIQAAVAAAVPLAKVSPFTRRWWNADLTALRTAYRRLRGKAFRRRARRNDPIHEECAHAHTAYSDAIDAAKRAHWEEWLERVDADSIWTGHRYVSQPPSD